MTFLNLLEFVTFYLRRYCVVESQITRVCWAMTMSCHAFVIVVAVLTMRTSTATFTPSLYSCNLKTNRTIAGGEVTFSLDGDPTAYLPMTMYHGELAVAAMGLPDSN